MDATATPPPPDAASLLAGAASLLACIDGDENASDVVRFAASLSAARWCVAHADTPRGEENDPARIRRVDEAFLLAESLGAETRRLAGDDPAETAAHFAREFGAEAVVLARPREKRFRRRDGFAHNLARRAPDLTLHFVRRKVSAPALKRRIDWRGALSPNKLGLLAALGSVTAASAASQLLLSVVSPANLSMLYLLGVLACAARFGMQSAIAAALLSFLAYNFFFLSPRYSFAVVEPQEFLALVAFLFVAVLTGSLAARVRAQAEAARQRAVATEVLYDFSRKLSAAARPDETLAAAADLLHKARGLPVALLLPEGRSMRLAATCPPGVELSHGEIAGARCAYVLRKPSGYGAEENPAGFFRFVPLVTPRGVLGVCGLDLSGAPESGSAEDDRALAAMIEQTAVAIDRAQLVGEAMRAAALVENERLRTTLLSSLSHDLRTPLSSITGAVTTLRVLGDQMEAEDRIDLLASIEEEAARMTRFVANLLDMSKLESGALEMRRDFLDPGEIVRVAVRRVQKVFPEMTIETALARGLPFIRGDAGLLEQVLFNLLDNAHKYGGETGASVEAHVEQDQLLLAVTDSGPGIRESDLERIFEKFYRGGKPDGRKAGTGLGLSICKGLVEAMGGRISAQSPVSNGRGARLTLAFPTVAVEREQEA